jgi:hypothetical protein
MDRNTVDELVLERRYCSGLIVEVNIGRFIIADGEINTQGMVYTLKTAGGKAKKQSEQVSSELATSIEWKLRTFVWRIYSAERKYGWEFGKPSSPERSIIIKSHNRMSILIQQCIFALPIATRRHLYQYFPSQRNFTLPPPP